MIKITLLLISSLPVMAGAVISAGLPALANQFSEYPQAEFLAKLMLTVPALLVAIFGPYAGALSDRLGRKKVLLGSLLLFTVTGTSGLYFSHPLLLLSGRALLGISIAGIMSISMALAGDLFEGEERQSFIGMQSAFMALGGLVFITLGGWLADLHWRLPFGVYLVALLFWLLSIKVLPERTPGKTGIDMPETKIPGTSLYPIGMVFLLAFLGMGTFYFVPVQLPFFLKSQIQATGIQAGSVIGIATLFGAVSGFSFNRLRNHLSFLSIMMLSFFFVGMGFSLISYTQSFYWALGCAIPVGLGFGLLIPNCNLKTIDLAPEALRGKYLGGLTSAIFLGQFSSPFIIYLIPGDVNIFRGGSYFLYFLAICVFGVMLIKYLTRTRQLSSP